ncbi:hypothetical protein LSH36_16g03026 [Paralvinella palmiformis]|uniref:Uncharacterized protein n=1 Tax=Paralvinella palmiformis TaxID=53620 RepID=A0AAD9KB71_9ANNE|nr:hypothetical protein LSH36_16g03026 [Paralvinella palmiformis]
MDDDRADSETLSENVSNSSDAVVPNPEVTEDERTENVEGSDHRIGQQGSPIIQLSDSREWHGSPYTDNQNAEVYDYLIEPTLGSVYAIEFREVDTQNGNGGTSKNVSNRVSPTETQPDEHLVQTETNLLLIQLPPVRPPVGHHGDYKHCIPAKLRKFSKFGTSDSADERKGFYDEKLSLSEDTALGRMFVSTGFSESLTLGNKEGRKQARSALKIADSLVSVPLSKVWHVLTEVLTNMLFLLNIAVAAADIIQGPQYLYFKVTAFLLGFVENLFMGIMWAISKHPKFKNSDHRERFEKYQQYTENVLSETLIYPLFVLGILGFTTEKMYESSGAFTYLQVALLIFDVLTLIYNQVIRMHMFRRLITDLKTMIATGSEANQSTWTTAGYILPRCYWTVICNFIVMLTLAALFGVQTNLDNNKTSDYRLTLPSALIMIMLIILPSASLLLFFVVNLYWISEILIKISLGVGADAKCQNKLREQYGDTLSDALHYSRSKIPASERRLAKIQESTTTKKLLFCLCEIPFSLIIFLFQCLLLYTAYSFSGFEDAQSNLIAKLMLLLLFIIANPHLSLLMLFSNFMILGVILGTVAYPVCIPLMCKKQYSTQSKYSELTSTEQEE